jgi:hypothetical protein
MLTIYTFLISSLMGLYRNDPGAEKVIRQMYDRYHGKWFSSFTFLQTTESYKNDTLSKKTTWYEAISFPDKFRIDFGNPSEGNAVIFRNDSVYSFEKGQLKNKGVENNDLTFLLGGMYFYPFDRVLKQLTTLHYDLSKFHKDRWNNKDVYVIGANNNEEKLNQLWIDQEKLVLVRMIKYDDNRKEEGLFENQIQAAGGWSETVAVFYIDDKLIQKEFYYDCKTNPVIDPRVFEPSDFGKVHWNKP